MIERTAAARALGDDHVAAQSGEQTDGRRVDFGGKYLLRATGQQRDAGFARSDRRVNAGALMRVRTWQVLWRQGQHRPCPARQHALTRDQPGERPQQAGTSQSQAKQPRPRNDPAQYTAHRPLGPGPAVGAFDVGPRVVDEVHIVHAGRACRHAGQTGQATIHMQNDLGRCRLVLFQHVLDQINPPSRTVEFVAEQLKRRTGRGAKAAMHAGPQHLIGGGGLRISQLRFGEIGLHPAIVPRKFGPGSKSRADPSPVSHAL